MDKELKYFLSALSIRLDVIISMLSQIISKNGNTKEINKQVSSIIIEELKKIKEEIEKGE